MSRRQYGSGSIYQRQSDGRWMGVLQAGYTRTGTRRTITVSYRAKPGQSDISAQSEVKRRLEAKRKVIAVTGLPVAGVSSRATIQTWAPTWLDDHADKVRASTYATDAGAMRKWIVPTIGKRRLEDLTPADVRAVTRAVMDAGRESTTARHAQATLKKMLRDAILEGHQVPPRVLLVEAPPVAANDRGAIPLADALLILRTAAEHPDASRWVAAFLGGLRQGEALGLTWPQVDLDAHRMTIVWQLDPLPYLDRKAGTFRVKPGQRVRHLVGAWHLTEVKTASGERSLPIVGGLAASLAAWRETAPRSPHGLVWPRPDGSPRSDKDDRAEWHALQDAAGVRHESGRYYGVHEIRHSCATMLRLFGAPDEVVISILGHSTILTSRAYIHTAEDTQRAALEGIAARLGLTLPQIEG